jgi:hypothetical protein
MAGEITTSPRRLMGPAELVRPADHPHARFQRGETTTRLTRTAGLPGEPLAHRASEAFDERRMELDASCRQGQKLLSLLNGARGHAANDRDHVVCRGFL